jgi:hypothetical protein
MREKSTMNWSRATFFALGMTALGRALQIADGELGRNPYPAIICLTIAILMSSLAIFTPRSSRIGQRGFTVVVTLCVMINFAQLVTKSPCVGVTSPDQLAPFAMGFAAAALLCGVMLADQGIARVSAFAGLLLLVAILGGWAILNRPNPHIDVYVFQTDSSAALANGHDPYELTFPNVFAPDTSLYAEGIVQDGRLQFGYPYLPETLFAVMPASLLHFDVRYAQLAAILGSAILIVAANPSSLGFAAAILFLTTPRLFFVLEKSWTEPIVLLMLSATIACAIRWPRLLPIMLGLFLASKQYVPFAAILFFVGSRPMRQTILLLIKAGVVALIVTLPLVLWDLSAFWHSAIALQFHQPFRYDALSYLSWIGESSFSKTAVVLIPFAALLSSVALVLWRRRSIGFAASVAFCFLLFFAFNKQAFANYYFFVIGAMACAVAELAPNPNDPQLIAAPGRKDFEPAHVAGATK